MPWSASAGSAVSSSNFLARLGVGGLVLIDDDIVDETNLPRLLAAERDYVGRSKTLPAVRNARRANPDIGLDGDGGTGRDQHGATVVELL
ncbi:ThiF family adenylyltransferase [Micromonospora aurantiaca (nom. illeg.)]|uniref:ThiF family adenylyltransferase n=1 Tax=Micromonospora aurantiaca (nom. illeg.) TaxID=47850 RepID=UPI003F4A3709